jgi:DNA-directed RNA polymerase I subunit RPA2
MRKLYALVDKEIEPDNAESVCNQEILLPGHVYTAVFKDKVQEWLNSMRFVLQKMAFSSKFKSMTNEDIVETALSKLGEVGSKMNYFLSTGNITAKSGLDFRQKSGFSIMAERLNFLRYISHYRSVHRGQFYTEMRTTAVRKLLPDSWGYLCPVHTPDGAPCGLLNHLASPCEITQELYQEDRYVELQRLLTSLGVREPNSFVTPDFVSVFCDGIIMGYVQASHAQAIAETLRKIKVTQKSTLKTLSIPLEQFVSLSLFVNFGSTSQ